MRHLLFVLITGLLSLSVPVSAENLHLDPAHVDLSDKASLQRGARTFVNYCLSCHSAAYMRYNRMGKDLGLTDKQVKQNLMFASDKIGDTMTVAMRPKDAAKWFGVAPPDLSVIARAKGSDWLYTYLRSFYLDNKRPVGTNNMVFKDVAMPHVLWQLQGYHTRAPGEDGKLLPAKGGQLSEYDYNEMVHDLVNFMTYMGEPSKLQRLALGKWVLLYLILFFLVAYPLKRIYWKDVH